MDLNALQKNVTLLSTPYCDFSVLDEEGNAFINAGLPAFTGSYADWAQTLIFSIASVVVGGCL